MSAAITTPERPEPEKGQVWRRHDANGGKVEEFEIRSIKPGRHGNMEVFGRTGHKNLRAFLSEMRTNHTKFEFVHADYVKKPDPNQQYEVRKDDSDEWVPVTNAKEIHHNNLLPRLNFYWPDGTWGQAKTPNWRIARVER